MNTTYETCFLFLHCLEGRTDALPTDRVTDRVTDRLGEETVKYWMESMSTRLRWGDGRGDLMQNDIV
jgi:hypothetical protein